MEPGTTRHALLRALLKGPDTAQALAGELGVDTAAARRHLEGFLEGGHVAALFRQEGLGRPKKYYELTLAGRESLTRRYDLLLRLVAEAAVESGGPEGLGRLMDAAAEKLAREFEGRVPRRGPLRERVRALAALLRELGFPTEVEERDGRITVVRRDCIFLKLANAHPEAVCGRLDTALVSRLLGEKVALTHCLPAGDGTCRHDVRPS